MKIIKYKCLSESSPKIKLGTGEVGITAENLYEAKLKLDNTMRSHIAAGDSIIYRNRHSMKVEVNDD